MIYKDVEERRIIRLRQICERNEEVLSNSGTVRGGKMEFWSFKVL